LVEARSASSLPQAANDAGKTLEECGISLVSLTVSIDTASPGRMLILHMLGLIAELVSALIYNLTAVGRLAVARRSLAADRSRCS
jgi:DNA invertase Pin-like site-specific DNA recombinase